MKRHFAVVAAVSALSLFAAACGDDEEEPAAAAPATEQTTTPAEEPSASEDQDIVALAQATPELSTLVEAVTAAELAETLQGEGPYTVFAPTNEAFEAVGEETLTELLKPENREQLSSILTYHVVEGELKAADLESGMVETVNGEQLEVQVDGDTVKVGDATVIQADVDASNGVVHVIDGVLMPPS